MFKLVYRVASWILFATMCYKLEYSIFVLKSRKDRDPTLNNLE